MISISQIQKKYGAFLLDIDDLTIRKGEVFGLVGNNGAGKTTLFSLILDLIKAGRGEVLSGDVPVHTSEEWKKHTGAYLSESFLLDFLTPDEYFEFVGGLHNWNAADVRQFTARFDEFFAGEVTGQRKYIRDLSKGNQKKVGIIGALIGDPQVIILDEPFANLDPSSQNRLKKLIEDLDKTDRVVLISSHDLTHVAEVCNRIVILEKGRVVKDIEKSEDALQELRAYFEV